MSGTTPGRSLVGKSIYTLKKTKGIEGGIYMKTMFDLREKENGGIYEAVRNLYVNL